MIVAGVIIVGVLSGGGYVLHSQHQEKKKNEEEKRKAEIRLRNLKRQRLNEMIITVQKLESDLKHQESKLNNDTLKIVKYTAESSVVMVIGPTGYGKSLVCNRLVGDKRDIFDISQSKNALFDVAEIGDTKSNTKGIKHQNKRIKNNNSSYMLSIIDTQGAFDSYEDDTHFQNEIAQYFHATDGINMFCIVFKFGMKIDNNYQILLKYYSSFLGKMFWKRVVIIVTNCDTDSRKNIKKLTVGFARTVEDIKNVLNEISNGLSHDIPIYQYGEENFELSTNAILMLLTKDKYKKKYKCTVQSPMDKLSMQIQRKRQQITLLKKELYQMQ